MDGWIAECTELARRAKEIADDAIFWERAGVLIFYPGPTAADEDQPQLIHDRIMQFAGPADATCIEDMADYLDKASESVQDDVDSHLGNIKSPLMDGWDGDAADNFDKYVGHMMSAVRDHSEVLGSMSMVTRAYLSLVTSTKKDVRAVVNAGIAAIEASAKSPEKLGKEVVSAISEAIGFGKGRGIERVIDVLKAGSGDAPMGFGASDAMEALHAFAIDLKILRQTIEARVGIISRAYKEIKFHVREDLPSVDPDLPSIVADDKFDPNKFNMPDTPQFDRVKSQVSTADLVNEPRIGLGPERSRPVPR